MEVMEQVSAVRDPVSHGEDVQMSDNDSVLEGRQVVLDERVVQPTLTDIQEYPRYAKHVLQESWISLVGWNEVQMVLRLRVHPHIVEFLGFQRVGKDRLEIYLKKHPGDLSNHIQHRKIKGEVYHEVDVWNCALQLSSALRHIHSWRILHRDLLSLDLLCSHVLSRNPPIFS